MPRAVIVAMILLAAPAFAQNAAIAPVPAPAAAPAPLVKEPPLPVLRVPVVKTAPKVDGTLDDTAWKEAATGDVPYLMDGKPAKSKTKFYVARDDKALYIAVECFDDAETLKNLKAKVTDRDGMPIWEDDCVELFIDPTNERESFYQFIFNSRNVVWDGFHTTPGAVNMTWNAVGMKTATAVGDKSWILELSLPFPDLSMTDQMQDKWAFNVSRTRTAAPKELTFWSAVMGNTSHNPARFGTLEGMVAGNPYGTPEPAPAKPRTPVKAALPEIVVFDFEGPDDATAWKPAKLPEAAEEPPAAKVELSTEHATSGKHAIEIAFAGGEWPSVATGAVNMPENVFDYASLKLDVWAPRACVVALRMLQEKSSDDPASRWNAALSLHEGKNEVLCRLGGRAEGEALSPKLGKVASFIVSMYRPKPGESIWIDNVRVSTATPWPPLVAFDARGRNLVVSGVEELERKLDADAKKPETKPADALAADFRAQFDELRKAHPRAALATFRQGENGFAGWADAGLDARSPDGVNPARTMNTGAAETIDAFRRQQGALMRVDLSSIPAGSAILAARLVVQAAEGKKPVDAPPNVWVAEACNRPWVEGEVNAYEYAKDRFWTATGGMNWDGLDPDFLPVLLASGPARAPACSWDFTEAVRWWTDGVHPNHGFLLHGSGGPLLRLFTKESKDAKLRPLLLVVYEPK